YQEVGDAVRIQLGSKNVELRNNILWVEAGYDIYVDSDSQVGFDSDYNLFYTAGIGKHANWGGIEFDNYVNWFYELNLDKHSFAADPQFIDANGIDGVLGFSEAEIDLPTIIDNNDVNFSGVGDWTLVSGSGGFGDNYEESSSDTGADVATWTFTGLTPGTTYQIAATWQAISGNASNARYIIFDGPNAAALKIIDQRYAPDDFSDTGTNWEYLSAVQVTGTELVVKLTDKANYNRVIADAVRIQQIEGDHGIDDSFHLLATSPGVDKGNPDSIYNNEPVPNGGRINLGVYGNTSEAATSPAEMVQVLSPNGLEKFELGQQMQVQWHTDGLAPAVTGDSAYESIVMAQGPIVYYHLDESSGSAVVDASDNTQDGTYSGDPLLDVEGAFGNGLNTAVEFDGSDDFIDVPDDGSLDLRRQITMSLWFKVDAFNNTWMPLIYKGDSSNNTYYLYLRNTGYLQLGSVDISGSEYIYTNSGLIQQSQWYHVIGVIDRDAGEMKIYINGELEASGDVRTNDAVSKTQPLRIGWSYTHSSVSRFDGAIDEVAIFDYALTANQVTAQYDARLSLDRVDIELLDAATSVPVETIASDILAPGYFDWTIPPGVVPDNEYLIQVTVDQGSQPSDVSDEGFQIANNGTNYYVNIADDVDLADNEYTTAPGDNRNSGKSTDSPMSSLQALLAAYDLDLGDTIYVDSGTYALLENVVITSDDAGVTIQGPTQTDHEAILDRTSTLTASYVFELVHADDITLDHLYITGGYYGIYSNSTSDSDNVTISNSRVYDNNYGIWLDTGNDSALITGNEVFGQVSSHGIYVRGNNCQVLNNTVYGQINTNLYGINVAGIGTLVSGNTVYDNYHGIYASGASEPIVVSNNTVFDNTRTGIYAQSNVLVTGNEVYGHDASGALGIHVNHDAEASQNVAHDNYIGIKIGNNYWSTSGTVPIHSSAIATENRVYNNITGMLSNSGSSLRGNIAYSNSVGIKGSTNNSSRWSFWGLIENNLVYANTNQGIVLEKAITSSGVHAQVINNTVYQEVGDAVRIQLGSKNVELRNNILWVEAGYDIYVDSDSQVGFDSDY
ncbi:LamG-like jellyroll fold domain-containing protein, partial [Neptuniibacter sp.]|uniref:LamG-like jellyroll fold domain-containing protein n=1 Tax=Neptuniibacter sp. TaxID=1962643 RepID=UPI002622FBDB